MSADSSSTARRHRADPRLPVRSRQLLRVRSVWTIPLIMASVVVAVMTLLYISSVVDPLAHLRGLPVAVVDEDAGASIGWQHLDVQAGPPQAGGERGSPRPTDHSTPSRLGVRDERQPSMRSNSCAPSLST